MKLLIPTRNRPKPLSHVLQFLCNFYPDTNVIVADGSSEENKRDVEACVRGFNRLSVEFRSYPYELDLFDRILDVLQSESEEFIVMGADDDYPMMDALKPGVGFLRSNSDFAAVIGRLIIFDYHADGTMTARTRPILPITNDKPEDRLKLYSTWPYPLSYCLCRRDVLINRYQKSRHFEMGEIHDHLAGLLDCLEGKIHALSEVGVILTRHHREIYLRAKTKLEYLERGPGIAKIVRDFGVEIERKTGMGSADALKLSTRIFGRYVGQALAGIQNHRNPQFQKSKLLQSRFLVDQCDALERLFQSGAPEHLKYRDRMIFVANALRQNASLD